MYVMCFFFGVCLIGRFACAFLLLAESVTQKHRIWLGTFFLCMDAAATWYVTFYIRFISINVLSIITIAFILNLISFIGGLFSRENPAWLLEVGEIEQAKTSLLYIAKFNGVTDLKVGNLIADADEAKDPK